MGGGRLGVKNCGRSEIGGQKLWEVGDGHPCVTPPPPPNGLIAFTFYTEVKYLKLHTTNCQ